MGITEAVMYAYGLLKPRRKRRLSPAPGSVAALKQYVMSAWIEAEAICVDAEHAGNATPVMMIFKTRSALREVLHILNTEPPNVLREPSGTDGSRLK